MYIHRCEDWRHVVKAMGFASGDGVSPDDVAASFYHSLGIDFHKEYRTPTGRHGNVVKELFA